MMEQASTNFKTLKARFQGENGLKIQTKPAIPEKPKTIPLSAKGSNPLISSINAAVQKGVLHTPRVVFKDDKNLSQQLSPPWGYKTRENQPINNAELQDNNQKKDVDTIKQSLKDKNLPLVLPVAPRKAETPEPESSPRTPVSISQGRVPTSKNFVFTTQKTSKDNNEEPGIAKEVNNAKKSLNDRNLPLVLPVAITKSDTSEPEPRSNTPVSISPVKVSTPKNFVFPTQKTIKYENEMTDKVISPTPASQTPAPSHSVPAGPSVTTKPPTESVPSIPKAVVPQASAGAPPVPNIPVPRISSPVIQTSSNPEPKIPEPAIPTPVIPSQAVPNTKTSKTGITISTPSDHEPLKPNINILSLTEVFPPPEGSPPLEFTDVPPPVLYEDFPDGHFSEQAIATPVIPASFDPVPSSPVVSSFASPAPVTPSLESREPLVKPLEYTPDPDSRLTVSLENARALTDNTTINPKSTEGDQPSSKPLSPFKALARAEEMASVKRTPNDSRIFNFLERAKRKTTVSQLATTPENPTPVETVTPELLPETLTPLPETLTTEVSQPEQAAPEKPSPQLATAVEPLPEEVSEVFDISKLPPVDYVDHPRLPSKTHPPETAMVNGLDHRVVTVVKQVNPPPPPPRKALPATPTPTVDPPLERPTQSHARDLEIPSKPSEPLETHEYSQHDNSFGEVFYEDVEEPEAPSVSTFRPPSLPSSESNSRRPVSIPEEAFLKQLSSKNLLQEDVFPNTVNRDSVDVDYRSVNSGSPNPDTQASALQHSVQSSPALSPSGTLERDHSVNEDHADNKKGKTLKNKKQKGPLKNPYSDAVAPEAPPKKLFSRKNSAKVADEKDLKKKEKQREKDKEKEKEREKKEQKEKEREKKEQKEKERDKKEQKEKEREKKEQKEKEKKENEMRKKFKITGQEEAMYHVKVIEDCKGRKNDLPVKVGDTVSIIRTDNCPKGKWLAKDSNNKYGYVPVESMDLNINGIMELGKMTTASNRSNGNGHKNTEVVGANSRLSEHYDMNQSFSEDSDEWTGDDDDPVFGSPNDTSHIGLNHSLATPAQGPVQPTQTDSVYSNVQPKQEALQRLSTFFMQPFQLPPQDNNPIMPEPKPTHETDPVSLNKEEEVLNVTELLPPPDQYADIMTGDSIPIYSKPIKLVSK